LEFNPNAFDDLQWWVENDRKQSIKIMKLIKEIQQDAFTGLGKPEPLKHELSGCWSRRITQEHRLIYEVQNEKTCILACRYHY
jgi:toxin YoeB